MLNLYTLLADAVVAFHFLYVLFAVGGEVIILAGACFHWTFIRNVTLRVFHLVAVVIVMAEALLGILCPITELEYALRRLGDQRFEEDMTFVGRLLRSLVFYDFPHSVFMVMYSVFGIAVILTFLFLPPRKSAKPG